MTLTTFAEAEQVLAANLNGYQARPQQQRLAAEIERVIALGYPVTLLAQAGCGVGKSLGAIIPAILSGKRWVVATATKALQEQYAGKDMPFLEAYLGFPFTWALLKGRSNYACQVKLAEVTPAELPNIEAIRAELADTDHSGDFEHLANQIPAEKKYLLSMSSNECPGKDTCPFAKECFAEKAKDIAKNSQIVITNTAMLATELKIQEVSNGDVHMLGPYDGVLIDEAHELPEIAQGALADQFRLRGIENLASQIEGFVRFHKAEVPSTLTELLDAATQIWNNLAKYDTAEQVELKITDLINSGEVEHYFALIEAAKVLTVQINDVQVRAGKLDQESAKKYRLIRRCRSLVEKFSEFLGSEGLVRWVETDEVRRGRKIEKITILKYSPIEVGPFLQEYLWSKVPAILVSATLSVNGDFDYIAGEMGLNRPVTLDVGTPFDYSVQGRMFLPTKDAPNPSGDTRELWMAYAQRTTLDLVKTAQGGALLLYTSRKAMKDAFTLLAPVLEMAGMTCLMQGDGRTNKELAKIFAEDTHSVLFALKSFFTGVDFSGDACRLVIIDKLPFPVPSEIMYAAKANLVESKYGARSSFNRLMIPIMTLILTQGIGRLIRSVNDRGVVAILDPRLVSTAYGKKIVRTLPAFPVIDQMDAVKGFYEAA